MRKKLPGDRLSTFSHLAALVRQRRAARRDRWRGFLRGVRSFRRTIAWGLLLIYLLILGDLTLLRFHQLGADYNLIPGRTIAREVGDAGAGFVVNVLGNVAATIPLGFLLPIVAPRQVRSALRVALASFLTSLLIEALQAWFGRRVADVDDLILNTLGGWFGYGLSIASRWWLRRRSE